ncbi:MAG: hypothetical protein HQL39_18240 [Alphaproteobacteria bacterium]|nr:hypothetical protein [Alphaproteobacteria bacterium]
MAGSKTLIEFDSESGPIFVEVDDDQPGRHEASNVTPKPRKADKSFLDAIAGIEPIARAVMAQIEKVAPNEASVEFGVKISSKAGIVLASAEAEGTLKVTLKWVKGRT